MLDLPCPRRCNCLVWALYMKWTRGGWFMTRTSLHAWWLPHFAWAPTDLSMIVSYSVLQPKKHAWDFLWFRGGLYDERAGDFG